MRAAVRSGRSRSGSKMTSQIITPQILAPTTVAIAPTSTTVCTIESGTSEVISIQIENLDLTQTFVGTVQRKLDAANTYANSSIGDFESIAPLTSVVLDCDTRATSTLRVVGTMSGAGGNVRVTARRRSNR